ncbi:hypothetical protein AMIS_26550 [Actinoplanes missouriensis 431]|uniref:Peptidoglycan binding domain-containing protein n=1 Tax=Actinoplanes missouriensis (strain ATCC 14538 / DSM 43046 / CBS 188.64 / JCM 3121 / NBRC 102363 / NCIMB 12654 / NRRL B-3342 / UNCC 431) TaxID=512565 RepID=I0H4D8_ACTM4|nr:VanW family protein [Actinoplanes missouriensis]BAL87875.1 hypothetical protein AMIS_26550 [Actinoplanes missouriensis 431]
MTATLPAKDPLSRGAVYTARPRRRYGWLAAAGVLVLILAVAAVVLSKRRPAVVPAGRTVAGVEVGGLSERQLRGVIESTVRSRVEQPITVRLSGARRTFTLEPVAAGVRLDVDATVRATLSGASSAVMTVDTAALRAVLARHDRAAVDTRVELAAPATRLDDKGDASFTASTAGVERKAGTDGWSVDTTAAVAALTAAAGSGRPEATIPTTRRPAGTQPANLAGVDQLIGSFTTYHGCCQPRVTNIHLIARTVDGTVVAPGATFSLNERVGERTRAKGYLPAPAIVAGQLHDELGGGISQFSTTLYNAVWFAGLPSLKHQPHTKYISRYPAGREATLDWGNIENIFRNDTSAPIVIRARTTATSVTVALYGHTGDRRVDSVTGPRTPVGPDGGFSVSVTRTVHDNDRETGTTTTHWTYNGLD